jgi:ribosome-binding factor A
MLLGQLLLSELSDPRMGFVTVNRVELARDSAEATVYVSILGTDSQRRTCLRALADSRGYLQRRLGAALQARRTPILRFEFDESVDRSLRLAEIFKELDRERVDLGPEEPDLPEADDGG